MFPGYLATEHKNYAALQYNVSNIYTDTNVPDKISMKIFKNTKPQPFIKIHFSV